MRNRERVRAEVDRVLSEQDREVVPSCGAPAEGYEPAVGRPGRSGALAEPATRP